MLNLLAWIVIGGLAGWLAGMIVRQPAFGCLGDTVVGIFGGIIGGVILSLLLPGEYSFTDFSLGSLLVAFVGAIILLLILRALGWGARGGSNAR